MNIYNYLFIIGIVLLNSLSISCDNSSEKWLSQIKEADNIMYSANDRLRDSTDINPSDILIKFRNISIQDSKKRWAFANKWDKRVDSIIDSLRAIKKLKVNVASVITNPTKCEAFKDGYQGILWSWSPTNLINFYKTKHFTIRDKYDNSISDGRSLLNINYRKGTYKDYRSDHPMRERNFSFLNNKLYEIEFISYISWNYTYQMALDAATKIADEYILPKMVEQYRGGNNIVWYADCPNYRVLVQLYWGADIIDGEANRYISVRIMDLDKDNESQVVRGIARSEKRKKQINKLKDSF